VSGSAGGILAIPILYRSETLKISLKGLRKVSQDVFVSDAVFVKADLLGGHLGKEVFAYFGNHLIGIIFLI
jgi:hypothetical protein